MAHQDQARVLSEDASALQEHYYQDMDTNHLIISIMVVQSYGDSIGLVWKKGFLGANEYLRAKECFEQWSWEWASAEICHLHGENGISNAKLFVEDCKN